MTDLPWKKSNVAAKAAPQFHPGWNVRGNAPLERSKFHKICQAQDYQVGGFRILCAMHTGGLGNSWLVSTGDPGSTTYPDNSTWRVMARAVVWAAPGSDLEARALAIGSGSEDTNDLVEGSVRFVAAYANGANVESDKARAKDIPGSPETDGDYGSSDSWDWYHLHHVYLGKYRPGAPGYALPATRAKWSEFSQAAISLEVRGGARVIAANVSEVPSWHSRAHDTDASTIHGAALAENPTSGPRESEADGATYEERRYGTHGLLDVAERQATLLGPALFQWSSHTEGSTAPGDAEADPVDSSGTSLASIFDSAVSEWSADEPGFAVPCYYAERDHEVGTLPHSSVVPLRLRVYHSTTVGGTLRVQTTARSWVDIDLPATSGDEWTTITAYLEADPAPDVHRATLQIFHGHDSGGSVALRYLIGQWGHT